MFVEIIFGMLKSIGILTLGYCGYLILKTTEESTNETNWELNLIKGFLFTALISMFLTFSSSGTTCEEIEYTNRGSHCISYLENENPKTYEENIITYTSIFTFIIVPILFGVYFKKNAKK
jgi:hypothetical protein